MTDTPSVLTLIYDRHATPNRGTLDTRIADCLTYAASREWVRAGLFLDHGDSALADHPEDRPAWQRMLAVARAGVARGCCVVILVHDETRLAHCGIIAANFRHKAKLAGAAVVTSQGTEGAAMEVK